MHRNISSVERLSVHVSKDQTIMFHSETDTLDDIMTRNDIHVTKLTAFFDACVKYPKLIFELLYLDCPSKFI